MADQSRNLGKLIQAIEELPTRPVISRKVLEAVDDKNASIEHVARIVEKDPSLALKIIKVANSSFYGSLSKTSSLHHALTKLGFNEVRSIVLGTSVYHFFSGAESGAFDRRRFWQHAVLCSQVSKFLCAQYNRRQDDSLFLSGLVHDVGKIVLDQYLHEEFMLILERISTTGTTFSKAEKEVLGTTHYQISAKLLSHWKFPKQVIMQVLYHHAPWYDKSYEQNAVIVYLSNLMTKMAGFSCHPDEEKIDLANYIASNQAEFVVRSGFDLDFESAKKLLFQITELTREEGDNMMRFLE